MNSKVSFLYIILKVNIATAVTSPSLLPFVHPEPVMSIFSHVTSQGFGSVRSATLTFKSHPPIHQPLSSCVIVMAWPAGPEFSMAKADTKYSELNVYTWQTPHIFGPSQVTISHFLRSNWRTYCAGSQMSKQRKEYEALIGQKWDVYLLRSL